MSKLKQALKNAGLGPARIGPGGNLEPNAPEVRVDVPQVVSSVLSRMPSEDPGEISRSNKRQFRCGGLSPHSELLNINP